jgi:hypothetical protein
MIQNFWETTYDMLPGRDEVERKEREQKFLENADKLVQRKEELERKNREAKERFERESSEYDEKYRAWKKEADATKKKRSEKIKSALDAAKRSRISEIEDKHAASLDTITTEKDYWAKEKSDAEAKLAKLGFFKFGEKKATARSIEKMSSRISELEVALVNENNTYALDKGSVEEWLNDQKILIESDVEEMYPIPPQPVKPTAPGTFGATGVGILEAQKAISLYMQPGHLYTISDIHKGVAELANMSAVRVSAIMRQMIGIQLERIEVKRIAYFKLKE